MWSELNDPKLLAFYHELQEIRRDNDEDWLPMVRAIEFLQEQNYGIELRAFTSHARFQITTALDHDETDGHAFVGIAWKHQNHSFELSFGEFDRAGRIGQKPLAVCLEEQFPNAINALIFRLLRYR